MRNNYQEQKKIFADALKNAKQNDPIVGINEIDKLINDLYKLKCNGKQLKAIIDKLKSQNKLKPSGMQRPPSSSSQRESSASYRPGSSTRKAIPLALQPSSDED